MRNYWLVAKSITNYTLPIINNNYDRKNLLNKAILMKKELWLLKKNHGYSKRS